MALHEFEILVCNFRHVSSHHRNVHLLARAACPTCTLRPFPGRAQVFNALNTLELKSLEEPRYLLEQFGQHPLACLTLASFVATNTGDVARQHIQVPPL